ncbi:MAG TPA: MBL fold metallo-hydrolase [Candidatus Butyricicoccus stercorigallinarum]|nr:MBL fold metallo-hydrolase [Candidatus Butyricicoccus stercorigallinarum]
MGFSNVTDSIYYVGVNDHQVDLFEGQYVVPNGMSYNSYVIVDEKIAVMDTVDIHFFQEWLDNIAAVLDGKKPDYLIIQHMEPDHSASIAEFLKVYPDAVVVGNAKTFPMMQQFFGADIAPNREVVANGGTLSLGGRTLTFVFAPMVHWPEVMVTYDAQDKVLFSADGFGKFGALDVEESWACEARRYYIGIVGKYGAPVQALLKKAAGLDIQVICPLHGPVLTGDLGYYLNLYNIWSSYGVESEGVMIAYTSVYGNTKKAAALLADKLKAKGCPKVVLTDLARCDLAEAVEDAFRYGKLVLATTTYNADIFPFMRTFIDHLTERNYQNRTIGLIENGSWAPMAAKVMSGMLEKSKNITWLDTVTIRSALTAENEAQLDAMADALL